MMRTLSDRELLAHVARALDPGEAAAVEAALAVDPAARRRHDALAGRVAALTSRDVWILPTMPIPGRVVAPSVAYGGAAFMGDGGVRAGDHVKLRVSPSGPAASVRPVVVHVHGGRSGVLYPLSAEEWVSLDAWPEARGAWEIDVVAAAEPGEHRYLVVLVDRDTVVDWAAPPEARWTELREAVEDGRVPAAAVAVVISPV